MSLTVDEAIRRLNHAVTLDRDAMALLVEKRTVINNELAADPDYQTGGVPESIGLLGILNGIFGAGRDGEPRITAIRTDTGRLIRFERYGESGARL